MKKIYSFEPWFFIFFGVFHLHRIWALFDRVSYASFWINIMEEKGLLYFLLMGILSIFCILGIVVFFKNLGHNFWWRWIYLFGGSYLLFDLFAIATGLSFWRNLIYAMFDVLAWYWILYGEDLFFLKLIPISSYFLSKFFLVEEKTIQNT